MRFTISEKTVERVRSFLKKKHPDSGMYGYWTATIDSLGRSTSPGYTMDDAIEELLEEAGF